MLHIRLAKGGLRGGNWAMTVLDSVGRNQRELLATGEEAPTPRHAFPTVIPTRPYVASADRPLRSPLLLHICSRTYMFVWHTGSTCNHIYTRYTESQPPSRKGPIRTNFVAVPSRRAHRDDIVSADWPFSHRSGKISVPPAHHYISITHPAPSSELITETFLCSSGFPPAKISDEEDEDEDEDEDEFPSESDTSGENGVSGGVHGGVRAEDVPPRSVPAGPHQGPHHLHLPPPRPLRLPRARPLLPGPSSIPRGHAARVRPPHPRAPPGGPVRGRLRPARELRGVPVRVRVRGGDPAAEELQARVPPQLPRPVDGLRPDDLPALQDPVRAGRDGGGVQSAAVGSLRGLRQRRGSRFLLRVQFGLGVRLKHRERQRDKAVYIPE